MQYHLSPEDHQSHIPCQMRRFSLAQKAKAKKKIQSLYMLKSPAYWQWLTLFFIVSDLSVTMLFTTFLLVGSALADYTLREVGSRNTLVSLAA